jgi:hypothetical protein
MWMAATVDRDLVERVEGAAITEAVKFLCEFDSYADIQLFGGSVVYESGPDEQRRATSLLGMGGEFCERWGRVVSGYPVLAPGQWIDVGDRRGADK